MMEVIKKKVTSLFTKEDRATVLEAVATVHQISSRASQLLKAYYLHQVEEAYGAKPSLSVDFENKPLLAVSDDLIDVCFSIVQGNRRIACRKAHDTPNEKKAAKKSAAKAAFAALFTKVLFCYDDCFPGQEEGVATKLSLSFPISYVQGQLLTAIENNIVRHYLSYVKRYLKHHLAHLDGVVKPSKQHQKESWDIIKSVYDPEAEHYENRVDQTIMMFLFPIRADATKPLKYDLKVRKWVYLQRMVLINRGLEAMLLEMTEEQRHDSGLKLYSPISMFTSFVPNSIRLDTSGVAQLLMNKGRIEEYVKEYKLLYGIDLNITSKADLLSSYEKATGHKHATPQEEAEHATRLWRFLCKFDNKKYKEILCQARSNGTVWCFDNAITTDGFSASFQIVHESARKRKKFTERKKKSKASEDDDQKESFPKYTDPQVKEWLDSHGEDVVMVSVDPGKHDLAALTDGVKTLTYTSKQRNEKTKLKERSKKNMKLRKTLRVQGVFGDLQNPTLEEFESQYLSETTLKTCRYAAFKEYMKRRQQLEKAAFLVYSHPHYRQSKFFTWCATKSSEDKFANEIIKTFSKGREQPKFCKWLKESTDPVDVAIRKNCCNCHSVDRTVILAYGDWGRCPNALKGCAPTPGIGLRRRLDQKLRTLQGLCAADPTTVTTSERDTSQTCPCCRVKGLKNPILPKTKFKKNEPSPEGPQTCVEKHHLLRCTNETCQSRFWNRNVAGALNILYRFIETVQGINPPG